MLPATPELNNIPRSRATAGRVVRWGADTAGAADRADVDGFDAAPLVAGGTRSCFREGSGILIGRLREKVSSNPRVAIAPA